MPAVLTRETAMSPIQLGLEATGLRTSRSRAWVVSSIENIPSAIRDTAFANQCKDFRYYEVLERSLREQFVYRYLLLRDDSSGQWAVQPLFFVQQDLLAGLPRALRSFSHIVRKYRPGFLKLRMMMLGCAAGEGQLDHSAQWLVPALREAIEAYRVQAGASIVLLKDFPSTYRACLAEFSRDGFQRAPSMPAAKLELDFATFEEFMSRRLSKVFRKNLRRKFRAVEKAPPIEMEVRSDAGELVDELFALYWQTYRRSDFKFEELNKEYFRLLGQRMPDRVRYFIWRQAGRMIAFNLCMVHDNTLYDLDLGLDYSVAFDLHLYFVTWRDVITWCLENGIKTYHTGPLNYEPKRHLKLTLLPHDLYARHNSSWINPVFKLAIRYLEPTRHDRALRRFSNAHEL